MMRLTLGRMFTWASLATALSCASPLASAADSRCGISSKVCVAGPETRVIDGMEVHRDCWEWGINYACLQPTVTDTCGDVIARGGVLTSTSCVEGVTIDGAFQCINEEREYTVTLKEPGTKTQVDCGTQQYCLDENCFDIGSSPNPDFEKAVAGMEAMREAGAYLDGDTLELFKGQDNRCEKNVVQNCCKGTSTDVGGLRNSDLLTGGSNYMYDVLGVGSGHSAVLDIPGLDPVAYSLDMADVVVNELLKCDDEEKLLAVKREKRLCHYVGEYCSQKIDLIFKKICIAHKETHCCFNSKISRIINEHARTVIPGLTWGSSKHPACNGLTVEQFQSLDLSTVDFSEIYEDIVPKMPDQAAVTSANQAKLDCYFDGGCGPGGPPPNTCSTPWGETLYPGASALAYLTASAQFPDTCIAETRTCQDDGALSGSYRNRQCTQQCGTWKEKQRLDYVQCTQCPGDAQPQCEVIGSCNKAGQCVEF